MNRCLVLSCLACFLIASGCRLLQSGGDAPVVAAPDFSGMSAMTVSRVGFSPEEGAWIVEVETVGDRASRAVVHLSVGEQEAAVLNMKLARQSSARPMTHDLALAMVKELGGKVKHVIVEDIRDNVFLARVYFTDPDGRLRAVDSRASDAMILAVATGTSIHFTKKVIRAAGIKAKPPVSSGEAI